MTDVNHSPVALPPGSFDADELAKKLESAARLKDGKREEAIDKTLQDLNQRADTIRDPRHAPGTRMVDVERVLVEGVKTADDPKAGEVKVTETVQIFDPKRRDEAEAEAASAPTPAPAANTSRKD